MEALLVLDEVVEESLTASIAVSDAMTLMLHESTDVGGLPLGRVIIW